MPERAMQVDAAELVARSPWFAGIPAAACEAVVAAARIRKLSKGSFVYSAGEATTDVFCLIKGRLRIGMTSVLGQEFAITDIEPETWFGQPALASDAVRVLDASVISRATILEIPRQSVLALGEQHPVLYKNLFTEQVHINRKVFKLLGGMLFYPLRARLAGRLLLLVEQHGEARDGGVYVKVKLSQNDFARLSLGSRQRINKIFREWYDQGIVVMKNDCYFIRDLPALQREIDLTDV